MTDADLAVRAARAELERDQAINRAEKAERALADFNSDPERMLNTLHIIGIPARDLKDIFQVVADWNRNGGRPELLDLYREIDTLKGAAAGRVSYTVDIHDEITAICGRLHIDPTDLRQIIVQPDNVMATIYTRNAQGNRFLKDGSPDTTELNYKLTT